MEYKIFIDGKAEKELNKLQARFRKKIILLILKLKNNSRPPGTRKLRGSENYYRLREGDYRVIYEVNDKEKIIEVLIIRHRKNVYKN